MIKIPTYEEALALTSNINSPFYMSETIVDEYKIFLFNYRLAKWSDFDVPFAKEMRGITYVFSSDGSYTTFPLLEKFFNLNQVPETLYSEVKDLKIKNIYNKEDGSIASFIRLPNGKVLGKSKMSFDTDQAIGITRIYNNNSDIKKLVDWSLDNNITAIFEYVAPTNRIVLKYNLEDLILLKLRDNLTGELLDLNNYLDVIGNVSIVPNETGYTLDELIVMSDVLEDKEGWIVEFTNGLIIKVKTNWYFIRHGLMTNDLNRENILIGYILDETIDDILSQIPIEDVDSRNKINVLINVVKKALSEKESEILMEYNNYLKIGSRKEYAINYRKGNKNFSNVMSLAKIDELSIKSKEEIIEIYDNYDKYLELLEKNTPYNLAKKWLHSETNNLEIARNWLEKRKDI